MCEAQRHAAYQQTSFERVHVVWENMSGRKVSIAKTALAWHKHSRLYWPIIVTTNTFPRNATTASNWLIASWVSRNQRNVQVSQTGKDRSDCEIRWNLREPMTAVITAQQTNSRQFNLPQTSGATTRQTWYNSTASSTSYISAAQGEAISSCYKVSLYEDYRKAARKRLR